MAKTSSDERIYTIPLRSSWLPVPRIERNKKAVNTIKLFLSKHMHADDIKISQKLNKLLWKRSIKKPPSSVRVKVKVDSGGIVTASLPEEILKDKTEKKKGKKEEKDIKPENKKEKHEDKKTEKHEPEEKKETDTKTKVQESSADAAKEKDPEK